MKKVNEADDEEVKDEGWWMKKEMPGKQGKLRSSLVDARGRKVRVGTRGLCR